MVRHFALNYVVNTGYRKVRCVAMLRRMEMAQFWLESSPSWKWSSWNS